MNDPDALLRSGDLDGARAALVDIVRTRPGDDQARMFLFQLLCVTGEWAKARKQLEALVQVAENAQMLGATYNQVLDAELVRDAVFRGEAEMPVLVGMGGWIEGVARAMTLLARRETGSAEASRDEAFDAAPDTPGQFTDHGGKTRAFEWIADNDMRFGPCFEAIVAGRYGLIPFEAVKSIKSPGPADLRDTVWLPVEMALRSGQSVAAFLPARYPGSEQSPSALVRLGRETDWAAQDWGEAGLGQRLWSLSDGSDCGLLDLRELVFD